MFELILFVISTLLVCVLLMLVPKNEEELNGVTWLTATVTLLICIWVFLSGIMNQMGVKINLISLSAMNGLVSVPALLFIRKRKKCQKYFVKYQDILMILVFLILTVLIGLKRYGVQLDVFAYGSDDSVRHFAASKELISTGNITRSRYTMYLIDLIFIKCLDPFIGEANWYRAYLMADMFLLFMMGAMFWAWIRKFIKSKYSMYMGYGFSLMYFLGYPLTNLLYGFEYLGAGILMINFLLWVIQRMDFEEISSWMYIVLLMLANTGVCLSYTQFAPAVLVGELIYLILYNKKRKKLFSINSLMMAVCGFIIPGCLCINYVAARYWEKLMPVILAFIVVMVILLILSGIGIFVQAKIIRKRFLTALKENINYIRKNKLIQVIAGILCIITAIWAAYKYIFIGMIVQFASKEQGMVLDGSIYREPYANFLVLLFPLMLYIVDCIRKRRNDASLWMFAGILIFSVWLIYSIINGSIGSYYFYKMHFLVWLILFGCSFRQITMIKGETRTFIKVYFMTAMILLCISLTGMEEGLTSYSDWLWPDNAAKKMFGVYNHNLEMLESGGNVDSDMQAMYNVVREIVKREDTFVPYFGEELRYLKEYYYYLTEQDPLDHPENLNEKDYPSFNIREDLEKLGITYIFVEKEYNGPYDDYKQEFDVMWTEYENDYGWILKLD